MARYRGVALSIFTSIAVAQTSCGGSRAGLAATEGASPDATAISDVIRAIVDGSRPLPRRSAELATMHDSLTALYSPDAAPLWTEGGRALPRAQHAVALLRGADSAGLSPEDYDAAWLEQQRLARLDGTSTPTEDLAVFDTTLSTELLRFLRDIHRGRVMPAEVGFAYHVDMKGADLGARLRRAAAEDQLDRLVAELEPAFAQYRRLTLALARHRDLARDGSVAPGRVRQIELALERLRWLPHAPPGRLLVANVPAFRLVAFRSASDEKPLLQMGIVAGRAARTQTPLFANELRHVIFHPAWYPPASIIRKEILPAIARDPGYLGRERMELVAATDDASRALAPTPQNLARLRAGRLGLRQRPGPQNALGLVKFVFPNDYRVYMHGTPAQALFARKRRDFSHGCIRVEQPAALAEFVLAQQPGWTREKIEAAMNGARPMRVDVVPPITVMIFYTTVIVLADGTIEFFDDIYGLDAVLDRALSARSDPGPGRSPAS